jgi:ORF6N domain
MRYLIKAKKMNEIIIIPNEVIENKIYLIRNDKVMLDRDLSDLFEVKPYRLREQVSRNLDKFPKHFMFQLNEAETELMIKEKAIPSKQALGGSLPYVFTEHGVLQLANVIKSEKATQMSIKIIEIFVGFRNYLTENLTTKLEIEEIKKKLINHDKNIELVFSYLDELMDKKEKQAERTIIGYKN